MNKSILTLLLIFSTTCLFAQSQLTQTIRGSVIDKNTRVSLPGANVILLNSDPVVGTATDNDGKFRLEHVPIGRVGIKVSYLGFKDVIISNLNLITGKELILTIEMEEIAIMSQEVVISASREKFKPINEMATVSSRGFTIEETQRYAGSRNDVARMAANYAGVRGTDDSRNDIIIRGNSPTGLLWRLEGVDIPNPNHYGASESTGGPVSILNNNQLANSDFMTGAFPAEYGNAISGVFDLKMRNGNDEKHEFLGQIGFNGLELGAEGPLSRKNGSSYILNYRYSTLEFFNLLGIEFGTGTAIPHYQDISFKLNFPKTKLGSFSIFGIGGKSDISILDSEQDTTESKLNFYTGEGFDLTNGSDMAVTGITHTLLINSTTYTRFTLAGTFHDFRTHIDSITPVSHEILPYFRNSHVEKKLFGSFYLNKKINSQHSFKPGIIISFLNYNFIDSAFSDNRMKFDILTEFKGATTLLQPYFEWQYKINNTLTLNSGLHYQYYFFNSTSSLEPRAAIKWNFRENKSLSFGYGYHSQLLPITVYFDQVLLSDGSYRNVNHNLDMIHSQHFVVGYDWILRSNLRIKSEVYYQSITNAAVDGNEKNSYSILNQGANFYVWTPDTLVNSGKGKNYGLEITVEKFLTKGLYYLFTGSLYQSKYTGSDGVERNTAFNGNFVLNALAGKEWNLSNDPEKIKRRNYLLLVDLKSTYAGGQRYTPLTSDQIGPGNFVASYSDDSAYSQQFKNYFRTDLRVAVKKNSKKISMEWAIDLQNLFNTKNIFSQNFNTKTGEVDYTYMIGLLVVPQFKIEF